MKRNGDMLRAGVPSAKPGAPKSGFSVYPARKIGKAIRRLIARGIPADVAEKTALNLLGLEP